MRSHKARVIGSIIILFVLGGCAVNQFKENYQSQLERWPSGEATRLLPFEGKLKLVTSTNMRSDALRMMENGYLLLGRSKFRGEQVNLKSSEAVAKELGASVVMVEEKFATSETSAVPMSEWIPARIDTVTETWTITQGPNAGQVIERQTTQEVQGEFRTTYIPETIDYYDYAATYWARSKPPIFGVLVRAMTDEDRQRAQINRGVVVRAVIKDSPAFAADMLQGDIITQVAGVTITDPDRFFDTVIANTGKQVTVELNRKGEAKTITLQIRDE
jgi:serine protease Do